MEILLEIDFIEVRTTQRWAVARYCSSGATATIWVAGAVAALLYKPSSGSDATF